MCLHLTPLHFGAVTGTPTILVITPLHFGLADSRSKNSRPQRAAARKATDQIKEWVSVLSAPPEDVAADKL